MEIKLRKWVPEDAPALAALCSAVNRQYLSGRLPDPYTEADAKWWLDMVRKQEGKEGIFRVILADSAIIGSISVERKADVYARDAEIGYMLLEAFRGRGIMPRAAAEICGAAFEALDLLRITGLVYAPNTASRRVLEKSGFVQEGLLRNAVWKDGQIFDLCVYGKCR